MVSTLAWLQGPDRAMAQSDMTWRELAPENLAYMELVLAGGETGTVIIELNPRFAPETVKQFRRLASEGFYRGLSFYRVIDGFVA
ncbi:MAG: peptidylprolyl isomerase, partial [Xanthomonadales bacterium]|nr:peptidylprolyl isomerase [Xanthomonadales bacterium]